MHPSVNDSNSLIENGTQPPGSAVKKNLLLTEVCCIHQWHTDTLYSKSLPEVKRPALLTKDPGTFSKNTHKNTTQM
jgi:hypothetical protein